MSNHETMEITEVLQRVQTWPQAQRFALAKEILKNLGGQGQQPPPRGKSAAEVMAMLNTNRPAPDDATVKQWLNEYRMEKHGQ